MSFLVSDASCGPSNALSSLGKRVGEDRSHQADRFVPTLGGPSSVSMRSRLHTGAAHPQPGPSSLAPLPQAGRAAINAFDLGVLGDHLPPGTGPGPQVPLDPSLFPAPAPALAPAQNRHHRHHHQTQPAMQQQPQPAWARDFLTQQPGLSSPASASASASATRTGTSSPSTAAGLAQQSQQAQHQHSFQAPRGMMPMAHRSQPLMHSSMLANNGMQHMQPPAQHHVQQSHQQQQQTAAPSAAAWAEAFSAMDQAAQADQTKSNADVAAEHMGHLLTRDAMEAAEKDPVFSPSRINAHIQQARSDDDGIQQRPDQLGQADQDALARAAGHLVDTVSHDGSDKFRQSGFLELMRKLADRQATIQGDDIVDAPQGQAASTSKHTLDHVGSHGGAESLLYRDQRPTHGPGASAAQQLTRDDAMRTELGDLFAEEDARGAEKEAMERQAALGRGAFLGDGGDLAARMQEDQAAFAQFNSKGKGRAADLATGMSDEQAEAEEWAKYQRMGVNVPGLTPGGSQGWNDYIPPVGRDTMYGTQPHDTAEAAHQHEEEDAGDFVGRGYSSRNGRGRWGPQESEWNMMQDEWEAWDQERQMEVNTSSTESLLNLLRPATAYKFATSNPYVTTTRTHGLHAMDETMDWMDESGRLAQRVESLLASEARAQAHPNSADAWLELGVKQQENEREGQAISALRRALDLNPNLRAAWLALAVSYTNEGDRAQARTALALWLRHSPEYAGAAAAHLPNSIPPEGLHDALIATLLGLVRAGAAGQAQGIEGGVDADVQVALGVLFNTTAEYDKAADCFGSALAVRPSDWLLYNRLGATLSNGGQHGRALSYYHAALDLQPNFARCHFNLAISCINLKMYQDAAEHLYTALTIQQSQSASPAGAPDDEVGTRSLWETFRVVLEMLGRPDLAEQARLRKLDAFDITDLTAAPVLPEV